MPDYHSYARYKLVKLEPILWDQNLTTDEIIGHLNKAFESFMVRFIESYPQGESSYSAVSLDGATMDGYGWIEVKVTPDIDDFMNGKFRSYYSEFVDLAHASISHELAHREQVLKYLKNFEAPPDPSDRKKYLSDHREIDAFAIQASLELLASFDKQEALRMLARNLEQVSDYSDAIKAYLFTFEPEDPVMRLFLKKVYDVMTADDT